MLIEASQPHPHKKRPAATAYIFELSATIIVPIVQVPQDTSIDVLRPKLSEKKEITI